MKFLFYPEAAVDLEEQAAWYKARRPGLEVDLIGEVRATLQQLLDLPALGAPVLRVPSVRRMPLASFPLSLLYLVRSDVLWVVAVAHDKRRPGYWRRRL